MGSLFKLHRLRFKMRSLLLLLAPLAMAATMGSNKGRESRHFWGQNMTVPRSFQNMGSINIAGVGDVYVVMASLDNMDLAELLTRTSPLLFHTPRCVVETDLCLPQTHG